MQMINLKFGLNKRHVQSEFEIIEEKLLKIPNLQLNINLSSI